MTFEKIRELVDLAVDTVVFGLGVAYAMLGGFLLLSSSTVGFGYFDLGAASILLACAFRLRTPE